MLLAFRLFARSLRMIKGCLVLSFILGTAAFSLAQPQQRVPISQKMQQYGGARPLEADHEVFFEMRLLIEEERFQRAAEIGLKHFAKVQALPPTNRSEIQSHRATFHEALAIALSRTGKPADAAKHAALAMSTNMENALSERTKRIPGQLEVLKRMLKENPHPLMVPELQKAITSLEKETSTTTPYTAQQEVALRLLLTRQSPQAYLDEARKLQDSLEKQSKQGDAAAEDALSMIALVDGRYDEFQSRFRHCLEIEPYARSQRLERDERALLMSLADGKVHGTAIAKPLARHVDDGIEALSRTVGTDLIEGGLRFMFGDGKNMMQAAGRGEGNPPPSFLLTSVPALAVDVPGLNYRALEAALKLKAYRGAPFHNYESSRAKGGESQLSMLTASSLIARPRGELERATAEATWMLRHPQIAVPGKRETYHVAHLPSTFQHFALTSALNHGEAQLEVILSERIDVTNLKSGLKWLRPHYVGWLITRDVSPQVIDIGPQDEIDRLVFMARQELLSPQTEPDTSVNGGSPAEDNALAELSRRILGKLQPSLSRIRSLEICPDGALWLLPWHALLTKENQYLIEQCSISYADSVAWKVIKPEQDAPRRSQPGRPVIFADPDFDLTPPMVRQAESRRNLNPAAALDFSVPFSQGRSVLPLVTRLPGTAVEGANVRSLLSDICQSAPEYYTRESALEAVCQKLSSPEILVFATHGFSLPRAGIATAGRSSTLTSGNANSSIGLHPFRNGQLEVPTGFETLDVLSFPLLRAGLMLTGANQSDQWREVRGCDGILTAMEAATLDLHGTKLVVLSACETGLGDTTIGEGVIGLRMAFLMAGAQSVVASLWQVPDEETAELMVEFFTNLKDGQDNRDALRNAQLRQIGKRRELYGSAHPFYWAAFTLTEH